MTQLSAHATLLQGRSRAVPLGRAQPAHASLQADGGLFTSGLGERLFSEVGSAEAPSAHTNGSGSGSGRGSAATGDGEPASVSGPDHGCGDRESGPSEEDFERAPTGCAVCGAPFRMQAPIPRQDNPNPRQAVPQVRRDRSALRAPVAYPRFL